MYESYYGLTSKPFSMLPDPGFMYPSKKHQMALTLLEYGLFNQAGFSVISGETGAGKTTLLRKLLSNIEDDVTVGMISNTHKSFGELLDWVLSAFGIHESGLTKVQMHQKFIDFLMEQYASNKSALLIVDEAQNLKAETLEELRMLSNVNSEKDQLLQVILAGQPELKETLHKPELMQFAQRISVDFHLDALDLKETCGYIQHRLLTAGAERDVFTPEACKSIYEYSDGIPRLINLLCDTVMVYGFADQCEIIDAKLVDEMVKERMKDSVVPILKNLTKNKARNSKNADQTIDLHEFPWISPPEGIINAKQSVNDAVDDNATTDKTDTKPASNKKTRSSRPTKRKKTISADSDATRSTASTQSAHVSSASSGDSDKTYRELINTNHRNIIEVVSPERDIVTSYRWMKLGMIAAIVIAVAAVVFAVTGNLSNNSGRVASDSDEYGDVQGSDKLKKKLAEVEQLKLEQERRQKLEAERVKLLEEKTETLQRERDEALAKAEDEKQRLAQELVEAEAAKKAAAEAAARKAAARERQALREAQAAARAAAERERLAVEAARRAEQQAAAAKKQAQMELELERLKQAEQQRQRAEQRVDDGLASVFEEETATVSSESQPSRTRQKQVERKTNSEKFSVDPCSRPTAKFLSTCR